MRRTVVVTGQVTEGQTMLKVYVPKGGVAPIQLPTVTVPPELLPLALEIQEARVRAEAEGSLRQRMVNVRTDARPLDERRVR